MFLKMPVYQKFFKQNDVLQLQGRFPLKCFYIHRIYYYSRATLCRVMNKLGFRLHQILPLSVTGRLWWCKLAG